MTEKLTGYLLLIAGIAIIAYSGFSVYSVFTKRITPVNLFTFAGISLDLSQATNIEVPEELSNAGVKINKDANQKQEIIPSDVLNTTSNIVAHMILMGFMVNIGFKIALLGVEMTRNVNVIVRNKERSILVPSGQSTDKIA